MKHIRILFCMLLAAALVFAALPAFAEGETYDEHDAAALSAFFEQTDPEGVKNGEKLFEGYAPDDPSTWTGRSDFVDDRPERIIWNGEGKVKQLSLGCKAADLYGTLDVSGCTALLTL